jgi:hypothetical protein
MKMELEIYTKEAHFKRLFKTVLKKLEEFRNW